MRKTTITTLGAGLMAIGALAAVHVPKAALAGSTIEERAARAEAGVNERRGKVLPMKHKDKTSNPPQPDKRKIHRRR